LANGTFQVTYDGWPVYMYFADLAPGASAGETTGQYLLDNQSDGVWYEVAPQGGPNPGTATLTTVGGLLAVSSSAFPPSNADATVYTFTPATSGGTCTGACARYWPPVLTSTQPVGQGLSANALGTVQRPDGTFQVTYNDQALYLFSQDLMSGDTKGSSISTPYGTFTAVTP
jgi:predicted lipoprotein with Yx(FWY)xxD motif